MKRGCTWCHRAEGLYGLTPSPWVPSPPTPFHCSQSSEERNVEPFLERVVSAFTPGACCSHELWPLHPSPLPPRAPSHCTHQADPSPLGLGWRASPVGSPQHLLPSQGFPSHPLCPLSWLVTHWIKTTSWLVFGERCMSCAPLHLRQGLAWGPPQ